MEEVTLREPLLPSLGSRGKTVGGLRRGKNRFAALMARRMVRAGGLEPPQAVRPHGFSYQLRLSPPSRTTFVVWTIPSPWPFGFRRCPSSLYTFPFPGSARDCHLTGSPEFGQFYSPGFPEGTQIGSSPLRLPFRHARFAILAINATRCTANGIHRFSTIRRRVRIPPMMLSTSEAGNVTGRCSCTRSSAFAGIA